MKDERQANTDRNIWQNKIIFQNDLQAIVYFMLFFLLFFSYYLSFLFLQVCQQKKVSNMLFINLLESGAVCNYSVFTMIDSIVNWFRDLIIVLWCVWCLVPSVLDNYNNSSLIAGVKNERMQTDAVKHILKKYQKKFIIIAF